LFKELNDLSIGKGRTYNVDGRFTLKFSVNGDVFEFSNIIEKDKLDLVIVSKKGNPPFLLRNGEKVGFEKVQLPLAIVANSIMITDKFPFYREEKNKNGQKVDAFLRYKYLGVRNLPQSASTRSYVRRTVEFIVDQFKKKGNNKTGFIAALKRATDFLELDNSIDIFYHTSNNAKFFKGSLTPEGLDEYFEPIRVRYSNLKKRPPFKLDHYLNIKEDKKLLQSVCNFCNELVNGNKLESFGNTNISIRKITYNLLEPKLFERLNEEYQMLEHLRQLGIISSPEILLRRSGDFSLNEASSGEYHFFSSVVGLLATVKPTNSLVLIDEPEISLHPNWQMNYLSFLRELFNHPEYATCHIIIATHSHFLISDLKGDSSKIIGLKRAGREIEIIDLPKGIDTYGWSAEEVLYSIFNVRSTRNSFLEYDLTKLVTMINRSSREFQEIKRILTKVSTLVLSENDPLKIIIEKAEKYIENNNA
jgi:hypothetical protein